MSSNHQLNDEPIQSVLQESKAFGFLGPGPIEAHIDHAMSFIPWVVDRSQIMDLGSGGGVPGLVIAAELSRTGKLDGKTITLVDANQRRCAFLEDAVGELGVGSDVVVVHGRAEELARLDRMRHQFDCVVARSFGPPAVVAECAAGFLAVNGCLVVSEPPDQRADRWNEQGLAKLGLELSERASRTGSRLQVMNVSTLCDDKYPRRNGIPAKRPLF